MLMGMYKLYWLQRVYVSRYEEEELNPRSARKERMDKRPPEW